MTGSLLKSTLTDSKFNMWRGCMAVIRLDGKVTKEEQDFAIEKMIYIPFSKEQKNILIQDFEKVTKLEAILPLISDKRDLAFLLHMVRVIGHIDHDYSVEERAAFELINDIVMKGIDLNAVESEIEKLEIMSYHEDSVFESSANNSLFEHFFNQLLKIANSGDFKFPKNK